MILHIYQSIGNKKYSLLRIQSFFSFSISFLTHSRIESIKYYCQASPPFSIMSGYSVFVQPVLDTVLALMTQHPFDWCANFARNVLSSGISRQADGTAIAVNSLTGKPVEPEVALVTTSCVFMIAVSLCAFIASFITKNDSYIDRMWSLVPAVYAWYYFFAQGAYIFSPLSGQMTTLFAWCVSITLWGIRLTYNFYRRGGYAKGGEDYRWEHIRKWPIFQDYAFSWPLFSFVFISCTQSYILWALTLPLVYVHPFRGLCSPLSPAAGGSYDFFFLAVHAVFLALETIADQQQWEFQNHKHRTKLSRKGQWLYPRCPEWEKDFSEGYFTHGLFAFSRHPNVFSEQMMWLTIALSGVYIRHGCVCSVLDFSMIGTLSLIFLTVQSTFLTEEISSSKYPSYKTDYSKTTPMLYPGTHRLTEAVSRMGATKCTSRIC